MPPLLILAIAVAVVLGLILVARLNAFVALITAALVVSLLAPGEIETKAVRLTAAFGESAGKLGVPIAMAAVIGSCLLASGAAGRIVHAMLGLFGEKRGAAALAASGFTLSIPVFFDTVFFLLMPLGRSLFNQTGRCYLKYVLAIGIGASMAHTLVPPTPGPLFVADRFGVDVGLMMLMGILVGAPTTGVGLLIAGWLDRRIPLEEAPQVDQSPDPGGGSSPGLLVSLLPIVLPLLMVSSQTVVARMVVGAREDSPLHRLTPIAALFGNPSVALFIAAAVSLGIFVHAKRPSRSECSKLVEQSLLSAGLIILITSAGGAFGAMLKAAEVGTAIKALFTGSGGGHGVALLWLAFGVASLLKFSQGSSTVAMTTSSAMLASMIEGQPLGYNPVYLAQAVGCGALCGAWMNDSGFWLFCRMSGLTEAEGLKSWTVLLAVMSLVAMLMIVLLATCLPLVEATVN